MSEYDDIYSDEKVCPKCGGKMEMFTNDVNVDDYNFDGTFLVCEECGLEMPREAYGFSSREEYEEWYDNTYERIYDEDMV